MCTMHSTRSTSSASETETETGHHCSWLATTAENKALDRVNKGLESEIQAPKIEDLNSDDTNLGAH